MKRISIERPHGKWTWIGVFVLMTVALMIFFMRSGGDGGAGESYEITQFMGSPKVYSNHMNKWIDAERGMPFKLHDQIQTDESSEVDLKASDLVHLRLKKNSLIEVQSIPAYPTGVLSHLHLHKGNVVILTDSLMREQDQRLQISTPALKATVRSTQAHIGHDLQNRYTWVGVLEGIATVQSKGWFSKTLQLKSLQKASIHKGKRLYGPQQVSLDDWKEMKETYELAPKSAAFEAEQLDLSKEAGTLYSKVFDHGTFYTPKFGFAAREFKKDADTGDVYLEVDYDVFPTGSYAGLYSKTRNFDISHHTGFSFEARRTPTKDWPEWVRIELKSKGQIVRSFTLKQLEKGWTEKAFKFQASKETPIHEITFVFGNNRVGPNKKGSIQMREFKLLDLSDEEIKRRAQKRIQEAEKSKSTPAKDVIAKVEKVEEPLKLLKPVRKVESTPVVQPKVTKKVELTEIVQKVESPEPEVITKPLPNKPRGGASRLISLFNIPLLESEKERPES